MRITPDMLESAYELLRATPPFKGWKLPPAMEVAFHVTRHRDRAGDHFLDGDTHTIRVSETYHSTLSSVLMTVAHEMCHMQQMASRHPGGEHGALFKRLAKRVCSAHGWDFKTF